MLNKIINLGSPSMQMFFEVGLFTGAFISGFWERRAWLLIRLR
jgi:hypothetical protein